MLWQFTVKSKPTNNSTYAGDPIVGLKLPNIVAELNSKKLFAILGTS
jgi:hypothetical protein